MRNSTKKGEDHIAPIVKYREEQLALLGDDYERPVSRCRARVPRCQFTRLNVFT